MLKMSCRKFPDPEHFLGENYLPVKADYIRLELADFIEKVRVECHEKKYRMFIHSFNHGQHTTNSYHYRGLAVDIDFKVPDYRGNYDWMPIDDEAKFICEVAIKNSVNVWTFNECDHLHFSVHPARLNYDEVTLVLGDSVQYQDVGNWKK